MQSIIEVVDQVVSWVYRFVSKGDALSNVTNVACSAYSTSYCSSTHAATNGISPHHSKLSLERHRLDFVSVTKN